MGKFTINGDLHMDVDQNPVPPVNLKVDGHPLYHMISRFLTHTHIAK